ncbi:MAG: NADPH-dependent FMN reductase [Candidatus Acidiferrales bacterium]|jgi:FMN reductase
MTKSAAHDSSAKPLVVGIGGSTRAASTTERALLAALKAAEEAGARTRSFGGLFLCKLPTYSPESQKRTPEEREFVEAVRAADGVIVASPGYHGGVSGLVKNAIDLLEDLREDKRAYLDGRAVGCIVTAFGWQACGSTLMALRSIIHALRGWPTPLGAALNTAGPVFNAAGECTDEKAASQLATVGRQVVEFAVNFRR